jgi:hypothetical protein
MPPHEPPAPRRHVLLIGIDAYAGMSPLRGCVNDIDAVEAILLDRLGVPREAITKLTAPAPSEDRRSRLPSLPPTSANIRAALEALAGEAVQPGDRVLIYYAGHGTQRFSADARAPREALVPADLRAGGALLYDHELNALLYRISSRTNDLTVVLDCCHSAGATRSALAPLDSAVRFCPVDDAAPELPGGARSGEAPEPPAGLLASLDPDDPGFVVAAACQSNEVAHEGRSDLGQRHGAFTAALMELLSREPDSRLEALRWVDLWQRLRARISTGYPGQHPLLVGRAERRLFGGAFEPHDPGASISAEGAEYRVEAGSMLGFSVGARVAVYGALPAFFPPLGSPEDMAARAGVLEVRRATPSSCTAVPMGGSGFALPVGARCRLIAPGERDALVVQLEPYDERLARWLERGGELRVVPANDPTGEPHLVEAFVGKDTSGRFWIGDELFGPPGGGDGGPLAVVPSDDPEALHRGLTHYAKYNVALRLARRCRDLKDALRVRVLSCDGLAALASTDPQDPTLPEVRPDPERRYRYLVEQGQPVCVVVENRSSERLYGNLLNCATSGKVEILGTTQVEIPPGGCQTFWLRGHLGEPFRCRVPPGRQSGVDRLIAVATSRPDVDLSFLKVTESLDDAIRSLSRDMSGDEPEPRELWTATLVAMKIARRAEGAP